MAGTSWKGDGAELFRLWVTGAEQGAALGREEQGPHMIPRPPPNQGNNKQDPHDVLRLMCAQGLQPGPAGPSYPCRPHCAKSRGSR